MALKVYGSKQETGFVIEQRFGGESRIVLGKRVLVPGSDKIMYYADRGAASHAFSTIQNALVVSLSKANEIANKYETKKFGNGTPNRVIPDPLGRTPKTVDAKGNTPVGPSNYFDGTSATFEKVKDAGSEAVEMWQQLKSRGRLDHVSDYGSEYVIIGDVLYRYADHWGKFASVVWNINPYPKTAPIRPGSIFTGKQGMTIGRVPFSQMRFR